MPDLSLVSTNDMVDEIFNRFDGVVIAWYRDDGDGPGTETRVNTYKGAMLAIGLCEWTKACVLKAEDGAVDV